MKKSIIMIAFAIATLTTVSCGKNSAAEQTTPEQEQMAPEQKDNEKHLVAYACPMDCEQGKTYDKPGKCPVCEMDLEEVIN